MLFRQLFFLGTILLCSPAGIAFGKSLELTPEALRRGSSSEQKEVSVLQNRFFQKSQKLDVGIHGGSILNQAYLDTTFVGMQTSYYWNETFGLSIAYSKMANAASDDAQALSVMRYRRAEGDDETLVAPTPEVNPIESIVGISVDAAPFYSKINFFDKMIIYSDIYVNAGYASVATVQGEKPAFTYGLGQRFFVSNQWNVKAGIQGHRFQEKRAQKNVSRSATHANLGVSYFVK